MSQFDMDIAYIKGEDNCVADALSRLPPLEVENIMKLADSSVNAVLSLATDAAVLADIRAGYDVDPFCTKLVDSDTTGVKISMDFGILARDWLFHVLKTFRRIYFASRTTVWVILEPIKLTLLFEILTTGLI